MDDQMDGSRPEATATVIRNSLDAMRRSDSVFAVRPLVVDSDVLLRNLVREVRPGAPATKLLNHMRMGTVRPFIAAHQVGEVRRHLARVAAESGVDPVLACQMFEETYLPLLSRVDVSGLLDDHPFVEVVRESDVTDADTAKLAVLLGVRVLTANKNHFKGVAIEHDWLKVVAAYTDTAILDGANAGIVVSVQVSAEGVLAAANGIHRGFEYLADHPRVAIGIGLAAFILLILGLFYLSDDDRRERLKASVDSVVPVVGGALAQGATWYATALEAATDAEPVISAAQLPNSGVTIPQQLAQRLATSRWPVPTEELIEGISSDGELAPAAVLRSHPAFVEREGRWVLGIQVPDPLPSH